MYPSKGTRRGALARIKSCATERIYGWVLFAPHQAGGQSRAALWAAGPGRQAQALRPAASNLTTHPCPTSQRPPIPTLLSTWTAPSPHSLSPSPAAHPPARQAAVVPFAKSGNTLPIMLLVHITLRLTDFACCDCGALTHACYCSTQDACACRTTSGKGLRFSMAPEGHVECAGWVGAQTSAGQVGGNHRQVCGTLTGGDRAAKVSYMPWSSVHCTYLGVQVRPHKHGCLCVHAHRWVARPGRPSCPVQQQRAQAYST